MEQQFTRDFAEIGATDVPLVGGKNASLGEMYQELAAVGVRVPHGFALTADAYWHTLESAGVLEELHAAMDDLEPEDMDDLSARAARARELVYGAGLPADLREELLAAYRALGPDAPSVAVRSSATAEDLPDASFAGQHESYLDVHGEDALVDAVQHCFASLFTDRAIHYRVERGFDHFKVALSVGVMNMVRSDLASSGVMFTLDTESGFRDVVFVTSSYGLGENVVQGAVDPDEFFVHKPTYRQGHRVVLRRRLGSKEAKTMVLRPPRVRPTCKPPRTTRRRFSISDDEVLDSGRSGARSSRSTTARAGTRRWTSSGRRTASTDSCTSCRRGRRPSHRNARSPSWSDTSWAATDGC